MNGLFSSRPQYIKDLRTDSTGKVEWRFCVSPDIKKLNHRQFSIKTIALEDRGDRMGACHFCK